MTTMATAYLSDKYRQRAIFLQFWSIVTAVGFALLIGVPIKTEPGVQYFATYLCTAGFGPMIATTISWAANTWAHHCESPRLSKAPPLMR